MSPAAIPGAFPTTLTGISWEYSRRERDVSIFRGYELRSCKLSRARRARNCRRCSRTVDNASYFAPTTVAHHRICSFRLETLTTLTSLTYMLFLFLSLSLISRFTRAARRNCLTFEFFSFPSKFKLARLKRDSKLSGAFERIDKDGYLCNLSGYS